MFELQTRSGNQLNPTRYRRLENRNLLANVFTFNDQLLDIDISEANDVTVSRDLEHFMFAIANGVWEGENGSGVSGAGTARIEVESSVVDVIDMQAINGQDMDTIFSGPIDFGTTDIVIRFFDEVTQVANSPVSFQDVLIDTRILELPDSANQFRGIVQLRNAESATIHNAGDIQFSDLRNIGNSVFNSEGSFTFDGDEFIGTALQITAGEDVSMKSSLQFYTDLLSIQSGENVVIYAQSSGFGFGDHFPTTKIGRLHFDATGSVDVVSGDDSSSVSTTYLVGDNRANELSLRLKDRLVDTGDSTLVVTGNATFHAVHRIYLGHREANDIRIGGQAEFRSNTFTSPVSGSQLLGNVFVGPEGQLNFGSVLVTGTPDFVQIFEDSDMVIDEVSVANASVMTFGSEGSIFDSDGARIETERIGLRAKKNIVMGENSGDIFDVGSVGFFAENIYVGGAGRVRVGNTLFQAEGVVRLSEDDSMFLVGPNFANSVTLAVDGTISNSDNFSLRVEHGLNIYASNRIYLANGAGELEVNGKADFHALTSIIVGRGNGTAAIEQTRFESRYVDIHVDGTLHLVGNNIGQSVSLSSNQFISDGPDARVTSDWIQFSALGVLLADRGGNSIEFCGPAIFRVVENFVRIEQPGDVTMESYDLSPSLPHLISIDRNCF